MDQIQALKQKAQLNLLKKQQVCTDSILKDFNFQLSMPLEHGHVQKSGNVVLDNQTVQEQDTIKKDVRAPVIEIQFDLQKDIHANSQDPAQQNIVDQTYKVNFSKVGLQQMFEQLERVQIRLDELNC